MNKLVYHIQKLMLRIACCVCYYMQFMLLFKLFGSSYLMTILMFIIAHVWYAIMQFNYAVKHILHKDDVIAFIMTTNEADIICELSSASDKLRPVNAMIQALIVVLLKCICMISVA